MENPLSKVLTSSPPPPPAEVKIRTMRSDIESMMRSGGGAPSFQNVVVSGLTLETKGHQASITERKPMSVLPSYSIPAAPVVEAPAPAAARTPSTIPAPTTDVSDAVSPAAQEFISEPASKSHLVPILIVTLVAIIAIGVVGYFAYTLFK